MVFFIVSYVWFGIIKLRVRKYAATEPAFDSINWEEEPIEMEVIISKIWKK